MDRDWARLGAALKAAREDLGLEQQQVAEQIGVKRGALRNVELGDISRVTPTVRAYARIVGWTDESADTVLTGGDPTVTPPGQVPADADVMIDVPAELPLRIKAALSTGPVLDSTVIDLPAEDGEDSEGQMVIIVKGRQQKLSPDQLRRALLQWEKSEAQIRRSGGG